jgi:hypothetical protein
MRSAEEKNQKKYYVLHGYSHAFKKIISDTAFTSSAPDKYAMHIILSDRFIYLINIDNSGQ